VILIWYYFWWQDRSEKKLGNDIEALQKKNHVDATMGFPLRLPIE
jgi:hypothetical protein